MDRKALFSNVLEQWNFMGEAPCSLWTDELLSQSGVDHSFAIGKWLSSRINIRSDEWQFLASHPSEIVREWAAILIGLTEDLSFARKLAWIKPFADGENAGLREMACWSLRSDVVHDPISAIHCLVPWTGSRNERLRRFAAEITRPCGVLSSHIQLLQEQPELGLPILEPLSADQSPYVQNSVGCWLNDAMKTKPDWVRSIAACWLAESTSPNTKSIVDQVMGTKV